MTSPNPYCHILMIFWYVSLCYRKLSWYSKLLSYPFPFQIINRLLPGLFFKNVQVLQGFENILNTLQDLKVFET